MVEKAEAMSFVQVFLARKIAGSRLTRGTNTYHSENARPLVHTENPETIHDC